MKRHIETPIESIYLCGCSKFSESTLCEDHSFPVLCTSKVDLNSYSRFTRKDVSVIKTNDSKKLLNRIPKDFDYLNINLSGVSVDLGFLKSLLKKSSANLFIQVEVEVCCEGITSIFDNLDLNYVGTSIVLSGKKSGFKEHKILYYTKNDSLKEIALMNYDKFTYGYLGTENFPDRYWLDKLSIQSAVFLNVSNDKCWPVINNYAGKILIHTHFKSVQKSLVSLDYRNIFPKHIKVPND